MESILNNSNLNRPVIFWVGCTESEDRCMRCNFGGARDTTEGPLCLDCYMDLPECFGCSNPAIDVLNKKPMCRTCYQQRKGVPPIIERTLRCKTRKKRKKHTYNEDNQSWADFSSLLTKKMLENNIIDSVQMAKIKWNRGVDLNG